MDLDDHSFSQERCSFKRSQIYEHIDDQIKEGNVYRAWLCSNDSFEKEYKVVYPSKDEMIKLEEDAKELSKMKRLEKAEKWDKKRKIDHNDDN